jgi:two-component system chemotaxis response regulator CheY
VANESAGHQSADREPATGEIAARPRVLVIDDDPLFRRLVVALLRGGFETAAAEDGESGYYQALEWRPHVALIDQRMPGWDGLLTLRKLRAHPLLADVKALMLTADASRETVLAAIRHGVSDYVVKTSFTREELWSKLAMLLGHGSKLPAPPPPRPTPAGAAVQRTDGGRPEVAAAAPAPATPAAMMQQIIDDWE